MQTVKRTSRRRARKKPKPKLSAAQIAQKARNQKFKRDINTVFKNAGFEHVPTRGRNIEFEGQKGEIDAIYVFENLVVLSEDTTTASTHIREHVFKTGTFFKHILDRQESFLDFAMQEFPRLKTAIANQYEPREMRMRFLYVSMSRVNDRHRKSHPHLKYLSLPSLRYFISLCKAIKRSARFELLKFLGVNLQDLTVSAGSKVGIYKGFVLPESPSGFPSGFKIVTFYIDPKILLELTYVLRKDSWEDNESFYQRVLVSLSAETAG